MKEHESTQEKTTGAKYALVAGALLGGLCLLAGGLSLLRVSEQEQRSQEIARAVALAREERNPATLQPLRELTKGQSELQVPLDDLEYAGLHERWRDVLRQFDQLLAARGNRYLAATLPEVLEQTRKGLLDLKGECSSYLQNPPEQSTPRATWKIYNLRGCLAAMAAYLSLEFDEDGRESGKFLSDAIEDFKAALKAAEEEGATAFERRLPGWNLELIVGTGEYFAIGQSILEENLQKVEEQLEPVLPNFGGYSPGAPLDIYVEK